MKQGRPIRVLTTVVLMVALLLMATAVSGAWHHHDSATNSRCVVCQVVHQTVGQPFAVIDFSALTLLHWNSAPADLLTQTNLFDRRTSSRSPPSA
jgi:hypothetical protein